MLKIECFNSYLLASWSNFQGRVHTLISALSVNLYLLIFFSAYKGSVLDFFDFVFVAPQETSLVFHSQVESFTAIFRKLQPCDWGSWNTYRS